MEERKRKRLTAKRKFEIYLETKQAGAKIGEILRREGIHLNDLREIEELVERGALERRLLNVPRPWPRVVAFRLTKPYPCQEERAPSRKEKRRLRHLMSVQRRASGQRRQKG